MKKEEIYLDLSKLSESERKEVLTTLLSNNEQVYHYDKDALENGKTYDENLVMLYFDIDNEWSALSVHDTRMRGLTEITFNQFKELFELQLKIGYTLEHNGFICEVKEPVKKWYYNFDTKTFKKSNIQEYHSKPITDQEFINQLEKHAK